MTERIRPKVIAFGHFGGADSHVPATHHLTFQQRLPFSPRTVIVEPGAAVGQVELWGDGAPYTLQRLAAGAGRWQVTTTKRAARGFQIWIQLLTPAEASAAASGYEFYDSETRHPCGHAMCTELTIDGYELCPLCAASSRVTPCVHCGSL